ncbi:ABC transporter substrate-binding protein [Streptomyces olivaceus]|uniref:ABC transporter substrate-binding protein n=1 Tax=Streptomyces olivaceus TaxID=47716 RepID=UPI0036847353
MPVTPTRRSVLAAAVATGAGLLTGCSSANSGSSSPKRGGTLSAAFPGAGVKETMDPHAQRQFVDIARHKAVFDKLVELDSTLRPVPRLARSWSSDDEARVWRFELREAGFHDGHVLDADDVLYSLSRVLDPDAAMNALLTARQEGQRREGALDWSDWWTLVADDPALAEPAARRFALLGDPREPRPAGARPGRPTTNRWHLDALREQGFAEARQVWCSASDALVAALR